MKRKTLFFLLGLLLLLPLSLYAYDFKSGDLYYNIIGNNEVEVTYAAKYSSHYPGLATAIIPKTVTYDGTTYSVTSIGESAFFGCADLISVTIPNSVTSIGEDAFSWCRGLISITIPNSVTSIGENAFRLIFNIVYNGAADGAPWGAKAINGYVEGYFVYESAAKTKLLGCLTTATGEIVIPKTVTSIGDYAFEDCRGITSVTIPEGVTSIGNSAFSVCLGLTSVIIPNSVMSIGENAFEYCQGLLSVTIPNSVTSIGQYAFEQVLNIVYNGTADGAPWGAKAINGYIEGYLVYENATKTNLLGCHLFATGEIVIPETVTSIGDMLFYGCDITSVTIPNGVTSIGMYAFGDCTGLTFVTIPNSVTSIGESAFDGCTGLISVTIPNSVTSIGEDAFNYVFNIVYNGTAEGAPWGAKAINGYVEGYLLYENAAKTNLLGCHPLATGEIVIPATVTSIGDMAFYNCKGITSVTIPESVTSIGGGAFEECTGLTSITILNGVTSIGDMAFYNCKGITSVTIPNSVTSIGNYAFSWCSGLTSVTIPNSVTSIGESAFLGCSGLTSITIPNSVTSIGDYAFSGCSGLTSVVWNAKRCADFSYSSPFYGICEQITSFVLGNEVEYVPAYLCYGMNKLTSVTVPHSTTTIGEYAFAECTNLENVTLGSGLQEIGCYAFYNDSRINDITCYAAVPPTCCETTFFYNNNASLFVPADALSQYQSAPYWRDFDIQPLTAEYTLTVQPNNEAWGSVTGGGVYTEGREVTIEAVPNAGCRFLTWHDGVTDNPRTLIVTEDATYTALFEAVSSDLLELDGSTMRVYIRAHELHIEGLPSGAVYAVYNAAGKQVYNGSASVVTLPHAGVYMVRFSDGTACKTAVR